MPDSTASRKNKSRFAFLKALFHKGSGKRSSDSSPEPGLKTQRNSGSGEAEGSNPSSPSDTTQHPARAPSLDDPTPQPVSRPSSPPQLDAPPSDSTARPTSRDSQALGGVGAHGEMSFFGNIDLPGDGKSQPTTTSFDLQLLHLKASPASSLDLVPQLKQHQHQPGNSLASIPDSPLDPFGYRGALPSGTAEPLDLASIPTPTTPAQYTSAINSLLDNLKSTLAQKSTVETEAATHLAAYQASQQRLTGIVSQYEGITHQVHQVMESAKQASIMLEMPEEFKILPSPTTGTVSPSPPSRPSYASQEENDVVGPLPFGNRRPFMVDNVL